MTNICIDYIFKHTSDHDFEDAVKRSRVFTIRVCFDEFEGELRSFRQCQDNIFDEYIAIAKTIIIKQSFLTNSFTGEHFVISEIKVYKISVEVVE